MDIIDKELVVSSFKNSNFIAEIFIDPNPLNPRTEFENLSKMFCFHKSYILGDEHSYNYSDFNSFQEFKKKLLKDFNVASIFPLYLYDHLGLRISITPFHCPWDSFQIGFVFITKSDAYECFNVSRISKPILNKINSVIVQEVKTYDDFLCGNVYGYSIYKNENDEKGECVDSCYGFFDLDFVTNEVKSLINN